MLDIDKKPEQQGYAALAIGTTVKDDWYWQEFEYWLLESDLTHPSELILKTNDKEDKNSTENNNKFENKIDNDNENENENIQKSMTGIEKLVSLLYHSTNNESFIMQNRPNLDELQVNVLYAISVAIRLNPIVQGNLIRIVKSDFSFVNNGDINKNESSSVGGKVNIDQSVFMNYLIKIAEESNRNNSNNNNNDIDNDNNNKDNDYNNDDNVSYELTRKIWTFIALILYECPGHSCRDNFTELKYSSEEEKEEFSNLVYIGEFFLTEFWFNLAEKTFEFFFHLYTEEIEKKTNFNLELNVNGEMIDENNVSENTVNSVSTDLDHGAPQSVLEIILRLERVISSQHGMLKLKLKDEYKKKLNSFFMTLDIVTEEEEIVGGRIAIFKKYVLKKLA